MDEVVKIFGLLLALAVAGGVGWLAIGAAHITLRRMQRRAGLPPEPEESKDVDARLEALENAVARLGELEERLDFAERLLAQHRGSGRIGPPAGE